MVSLVQELDSILLQQTDPARWTQPEAGADVKVSIKDLLNAPIMYVVFQTCCHFCQVVFFFGYIC